MADIKLFIYQKGSSSIHKTHPTQKILLLILTSYFLTTGSLYILLYYLVVILLGFYISKLDIKLLFKDLKYLLVLTIIITIFQGSIKNSLIYTLRIGEMLILGTIFTGTTKPNEIAPGLYKLIRNRKIAQNISLTINLIPTFLIGWKEINQSLNSRGLYLSKNPFRKLFGIAIPLLIETFKKSEDISMAMESRAYSGWNNTEIEDNKINIIMLIIFISPFLLLIKKLLL